MLSKPGEGSERSRASVAFNVRREMNYSCYEMSEKRPDEPSVADLRVPGCSGYHSEDRKSCIQSPFLGNLDIPGCQASKV